VLLPLLPAAAGQEEMRTNFQEMSPTCKPSFNPPLSARLHKYRLLLRAPARRTSLEFRAVAAPATPSSLLAARSTPATAAFRTTSAAITPGWYQQQQRTRT
jgi:hypothetical protein